VFLIHAPEGVDLEAKRRMLKKINDAVADAYHLPDFMIFIHEYPLHLVAHEGGLLKAAGLVAETVPQPAKSFRDVGRPDASIADHDSRLWVRTRREEG